MSYEKPQFLQKKEKSEYELPPFLKAKQNGEKTTKENLYSNNVVIANPNEINSNTNVQKILHYPKNKIVVTDARHAFDQPVTLILREKLFLPDEYTIKDINNVSYFKCEGRVLSVKDKKIIYDLNHNPILNIKDKLLSFTKKIYPGNKGKDSIAKVDLENMVMKNKFDVRYYNKETKKYEYIEMICDFFGFECEIYHGRRDDCAPLIGRISKRIDAKLLLTSKENYYVQVSPNVDAAFMVALAVIFDEYRTSDGDGATGLATDILQMAL